MHNYNTQEIRHVLENDYDNAAVVLPTLCRKKATKIPMNAGLMQPKSSQRKKEKAGPRRETVCTVNTPVHNTKSFFIMTQNSAPPLSYIFPHVSSWNGRSPPQRDPPITPQLRLSRLTTGVWSLIACGLILYKHKYSPSCNHASKGDTSCPSSMFFAQNTGPRERCFVSMVTTQVSSSYMVAK